MGRLLRYGLVGVTSNAVAYLVYLLVVALGATPIASMVAVYLSAATLGFWGNRSLTFSHDGPLGGAAGRYVLAHAVGLSLNAAILAVFVERLGHPHAVVQAIAVVVVAVYLFVALDRFVFASPEATRTRPEGAP